MDGDKLRIDLRGFVADPDLTWDEHLPNLPAPLPAALAGRAPATTISRSPSTTRSSSG